MKAKLVKESLDGYKLYGGQNKKNPPFSIGDKLQQIWRVDDNGELVKDGREMVEFVGMKGNMMLLKTLNIDAAHGEDTINPDWVKMAKRAGYKPIIGDILQLHYMYADRFEVIDLKESIQVPFSNKNRNAPISGSYPLSRLHYENADKKTGFKEDSDPIHDMGIGLLKGNDLALAIAKKTWLEIKKYDIRPVPRKKDVIEWAQQWIEYNDIKELNDDLKDPDYDFSNDFLEWWDH